MPDWLRGAATSPGLAAPAWLLAWRIGAALILGVAVVGVYRWARRGEPVAPTFLATLVMLSTLIAMAIQIIGDNVARAFSLVGALSVVRFRTVVKDTQDTAFVIFAVVVGMAAGADYLALALVGLGIVAVASPLLWTRRRAESWAGAVVNLEVRVGMGEGVEGLVEGALGRHADRSELISAGTARQGASLDLVYLVRLRPGSSPTGLIRELKGMDAVQDVELRRED